MAEKIVPQNFHSSTKVLDDKDEEKDDEEDEVTLLGATCQATARLFLMAVPIFLTASWLSADIPIVHQTDGIGHSKMGELVRILIHSDSRSLQRNWPAISGKLMEIDQWLSESPETNDNMQLRRHLEIVQQMLSGQQVNRDSGQREFWDQFYQVENATDWFMDWEEKDNDGHSLKELLTSMIPRDVDVAKPSHILILGAGWSEIGPELVRSGRRHVENIDISAVAIAHMKKKYAKTMPEIQWTLGDVASLSNYESGSFDFVFDKGTLDALGEDAERRSMHSAISEAFRVLRRPQKSAEGTYQPGLVSVTLQEFRADDLQKGAAQVRYPAECKEAEWKFGEVRRMTVVTCQ